MPDVKLCEFLKKCYLLLPLQTDIVPITQRTEWLCETVFDLNLNIREPLVCYCDINL